MTSKERGGYRPKSTRLLAEPRMLSAEIKDNISRQERIFGISRNNKGLPCPFKQALCQEGYCSECQIYLDWQKWKALAKEVRSYGSQSGT